MSKKIIAALLAFCITAALFVLASTATDTDILSHSPYDSYTRQALAWRDGRTYLNDDPQTIAYLELAVFEGKYYVSFPPVPSVVEFVLTFFCGKNTPDRLVTVLYVCLSASILTLVFMRRRNSAVGGVLCGLAFSLGTNIFACALFGGVWHEAQALSFLLCSLAVYFAEKDGLLYKGISLGCASLAVGCRPFTAVFIPILLIKCFNEYKKPSEIIKLLVFPAFTALALVTYNFVRFRSPFEFGHNYLPEFLRAEDGQFSIKYLLPNLKQAFKLPFVFEDGNLKFKLNMFSANIFYLVNPCILYFAVKNISLIIRKHRIEDFVFPVTLAIFIVLTCMHKTLGGLQFGARYFVDVIPYLALYVAQNKNDTPMLDGSVAVVSTLINFSGAVALMNMM